MSATIVQEEIDRQNQLYWNELCGSALAKHLGVVDSSPESLAIFDNYYMAIYPYLKKYLPAAEIQGKHVLEIGLGYGTMAQYLATQTAEYHGLDIAAKAVSMANHRLQQQGLQGDVRVGSMLECPFPDEYFDLVVSIGCFHHTGSVQKCVDQAYRILKPGGKAVVMVYNKFSLRQWLRWPGTTSRNLILQWLGRNNHTKPSVDQRQAYDATVDGTQAAPETEFFSVRDLKTIFAAFNTVKVTRENFDESETIRWRNRTIFKWGARADYLDSRWAQYLGLDLYVEAIK